MAFYIYKCNSKGAYNTSFGDWREVFSRIGVPQAWGDVIERPELDVLERGDRIIAQQSDRKEIVGEAEVVDKAKNGDIILRPLRSFGVKFTDLKNSDRRIASLPALQGGPVRTLYLLAASDARYYLAAAERASDSAEAAAAESASDGVPVDSKAFYVEGARKISIRNHIVRERGLRKRKLQEFAAANGGRLFCEVEGCGFEFAQTYEGMYFAEVHHLRPVSLGKARYAPSDLAVVCANCHRAIHHGGRCRPLKGLIRARHGGAVRSQGKRRANS